MNSTKSKILKIFFLILLVTSEIIFAQKQNTITIQFNGTLKESLIKIENQTSYTFYFQENWLKSETIINKSFKNTTIYSVLNELFRETAINYLITSNKIILTKSNLIQDKLPLGYFKQRDQKDNNQNGSPIVIKKYNYEQGLIVIGKEQNDSSNKFCKITGHVYNQKTKKPIKNLKIKIQDSDIFTVTNANGYYALKVSKGIHTIVTKNLSFQKSQKKILVYSDGKLDFKINEKAIVLDEVLISSKKNDNIRKAAVGITKINIEKIKIIPAVFGERDILKIATTLPGIKTAGEASMGFNVRGGKSDQNLIKLDNAVIYNPSHFFGVFSAINPYSSGKVSIYKGSVPSEFGGRLSSVIDITTKDLKKEKLNGQGNVGPITANLVVETPLKKGKTSILTGFRATYSDWILKQLDEPSIKNSQASFLDAIVRFDSDVTKKDKVKATVYYSKDKFSISSDSIYKYTNQLASIAWNHKFNKKNNVDVQLNNSQYKFDIINDGQLNQNFDLGFKLQETQLKLKFNYLHNKQHKFNYGISSKLYNISPGELKPTDSRSVVESKKLHKEKALESAIFIEDKIALNEKLEINFGLRYSLYAFLGEITQHKYDSDLPISTENIIETKHYDNNEIVKTYSSPEIRASLSYAFTPTFSVKGGFNNSSQFIHRLSSNTTASPVDTWKLSDLNIAPQKANQYFFGIFKNFNENEYEVSLEAYYKKMKNILDYKVGAELMLNDNLETELLNGMGKAYGIEFLVRKQRGKLNGWIGYSYARSLLKLESNFLTNTVNNGEYFPANFDKPHDFSLVTNYKLTQRYSISANFIYQTGRPVTYPIGKFEFAGIQHVLYSNRNEFRIPDYYRFDISINIEGNHKIKKLAHSFWNISVYNVLGRNNPYSVFFVNKNGEIKAYKTTIFSVPIPTITYNFKF